MASEAARSRLQRPAAEHSEEAAPTPSCCSGSSRRAPKVQAKGSSLFGSNGRITRVMEFIPFVNNGLQMLHRTVGNRDALERARCRNPIGAHGFLTKAGERIPVLADGIRALHKMHGQAEAAERSRAFSLEKLLSQDGAVNKVAKLLPGSNLVSAAVLELYGNHDEAMRALDIVRQWQEAGQADGALAKIAETIPGVDIIAFALHMNAGCYAQALRSITRTRWVDVTASKICFDFDLRSLRQFHVMSISAKDFDLRPTASTIGGGLVDICRNLLEVDDKGAQRHFRQGRSSITTSLRTRAQDSVRLGINDCLTDLVRYQLDQAQVKAFLEDSRRLANASLREYRAASSFLMRLVLPEELPPLSTKMVKVVQRALSDLKGEHKPFRKPTAAALSSRGRALPKDEPRIDVATFSSCLSMVGFLTAGAHVAAAICGTMGCFSGLAQMSRAVRRRTDVLVPALNESNTKAWRAVSRQPEPLVPTGPKRSQKKIPRPDRPNPARSTETTIIGLVIELPRADTVAFSRDLRTYLIKQTLCSKPLGAVLAWLECPLCTCFSGLVSPQLSAIPMAFDLEMPEMLLGAGEGALWMPRFRYLLQLELNFESTFGPLIVSKASVAIPDEQLEKVLEVLTVQLEGVDIRSLDQRFGGFPEPILTALDLRLSWPQPDRMTLELQRLKSRLHLPP